MKYLFFFGRNSFCRQFSFGFVPQRQLAEHAVMLRKSLIALPLPLCVVKHISFISGDYGTPAPWGWILGGIQFLIFSFVLFVRRLITKEKFTHSASNSGIREALYLNEYPIVCIFCLLHPLLSNVYVALKYVLTKKTNPKYFCEYYRSFRLVLAVVCC